MLAWELEWGEHVAELEEIQERTGIEPDALKRKPEVDNELWDYWFSFCDLHGRARPSSGYGPLGIPFTEIEAWLNIHGIYDTDERQTYTRIIGIVDNYYVTTESKRIKADMDKDKATTRR